MNMTLSRSAPQGAGKLFVVPGAGQKPSLITLTALVVLAGAHIATTWGYGAHFFGDEGRWLHEVERYAEGQRPYADYHWSFPPLSLWLIGGVTRAAGANLDVIYTTTAAIFLLIVILFFWYASRLLSGWLLDFALLGAALLGAAYAIRLSAPLHTGLYIPAAPVGFLLILIGTVAALEIFAAPRVVPSIVLGVSCGLAILTKHDFWPAALYLPAAVVVFLWKIRPARMGLWVGSLCAAFVVPVATGILAVAWSAGWRSVAGILTGFGHVAEFHGKSLPSWEIIVVQVAVVSFLVGGVLACLLIGGAVPWRSCRKALLSLVALGILAMALHLGMSYRIARQAGENDGPSTFTQEALSEPGRSGSAQVLLLASLRFLKGRLQTFLLPVLLPVAVLGILVFRWKRIEDVGLRNLGLFLLVLCICLRLRRMFGLTDWFYFVMEVPLYLFLLQVLVNESGRRLRSAHLVGLLFCLLGLYSYWSMGVGPLTRSGRQTAVSTPRGVIYLSAWEAREYEQLRAALREMDPEGKRPLFALGQTGGLNYFLARRNPTPLTQGFLLSNFPAEEVVQNLRQAVPPPLLIDNRAYERFMVPRPGFWWNRWEPPLEVGHYVRFDQQYFYQAARGCPVAKEITNERGVSFRIHDCARRDEGAP